MDRDSRMAEILLWKHVRLLDCYADTVLRFSLGRCSFPTEWVGRDSSTAYGMNAA